MSEADREKKIIERLEDTFYMNNGKGIKDFQKIILYEEGIQDVLQLLHIVEQKDKRIKELEDENKKYRVGFNQQVEVLNNTIKELNSSIPKQVVIEALENIEDYFERLNGPDEDIDYIRQVKKELLEGEK